MKPPEFLGPYRIGETLGKGGMGSVFKAKHEKSGQDVAVKLIATQMSDEMRFRRRFHAEIETLKRLGHPNIVKLIGYGEEQGMLFYSMEFVPGETLQELICRKKKLPWTTTLDIAIQVCAALKHAHDFGVIHRDLKPANLVIQEDGTVKLLDFGISKIFGHDQTAVGSIMGTADFMSPEQAGETGITARTDLFSLGCVIYAMLCGKPPFRGKNITQVMNAVQHKDAVPLDLIDPEIPEEVVQIVNDLLEKDPQDRPPTALAVMNRLKAMRAGLHRMQTLADQADSQTDARDPNGSASNDNPSNDSADEDRRSGDTTHKRIEPASADGSDTAVGQSGSPDSNPDNLAREADTVPYFENGDGQHTSGKVNPTAGTVHTGGLDGLCRTRLVTGVEVPSGNQSDSDASGETSAGASGKTHFQTVSDGELRDGFFTAPTPNTDRPARKCFSIIAISVLLLIGGFLMIRSLRGPTADQLLAAMDQQSEGQRSIDAPNRMERFLKLYPDHPRAEEIRQRHMVYRVEAAVRRLKLKAKLRTSDSPLYEQAFLDAMELRRSDPQAAQKSLNQWIDVFQDSTMDEEDEQLRLAELARFEADRLGGLASETDGLPEDPKLAELMQRIDNAKQFPDRKRRKLLEGIMTLYEGQPWAEPARQRASEMLQASKG